MAWRGIEERESVWKNEFSAINLAIYTLDIFRPKNLLYPSINPIIYTSLLDHLLTTVSLYFTRNTCTDITQFNSIMESVIITT